MYAEKLVSLRSFTRADRSVRPNLVNGIGCMINAMYNMIKEPALKKHVQEMKGI